MSFSSCIDSVRPHAWPIADLPWNCSWMYSPKTHLPCEVFHLYWLFPLSSNNVWSNLGDHSMYQSVKYRGAHIILWFPNDIDDYGSNCLGTRNAHCAKDCFKDFIAVLSWVGMKHYGWVDDSLVRMSAVEKPINLCSTSFMRLHLKYTFCFVTQRPKSWCMYNVKWN